MAAGVDALGQNKVSKGCLRLHPNLVLWGDDLNIWEKSHLYLSTGSEEDTLNVVISSQWELSLMMMLSSSEGVWGELTEDEEDEEEEDEELDDDEKEDWGRDEGVVFFIFP